MPGDPDERGRMLHAQVQFIERNVKTLEEFVGKMQKTREEQELFYSLFARNMQDVSAQEDFGPLAKCFEELASSCKKITSETHEVMLQRPEAELLLVLSQIQDWGIVPIKRLLDDREKAMKIEVKLQKEYDDKSRSGASVKEKEKKLRMLSDQKRRVENVNNLIEHHMKKFEQFRLVKTKKVLKELARSHAFYHAKALECFAPPCSSIARVLVGDAREE